MKVEVFSFSTIEKSPKIIEDKINTFLEDKSFKIADLSESVKSGKLYLSLYYENKKSDILAKVFRNSKGQDVQNDINDFLGEGNTMKWSCQSSTSSSLFVVVFYQPRKVANGKKENENQG